jgi:hypothetical protein
MQTRSTTALFALIAACFGVVSSAAAQSIPSPLIQEVLIKSSLLTFNDAVVTDNFTVMHAKMSKPFRDQFPPDKMRTIFKSFVDNHVVIDLIAAKPTIADGEPKIDGNGVLRINGHFDTTPKQLKYQLGYIMSEGDWKLSAINVDIK